jgi:hypothetical protein
MNSQTIQPTEKVTESNIVNELAVETPVAKAIRQPKVWIPLPKEGLPISEFAEAVGKALAPHAFFAWGGDPVRVIDGSIKPITSASFRTAAEECIMFYQWGKPTKEDPSNPVMVPHSMNKAMAEAVINSEGFVSQLRPLISTSSIPFPVYRDGKLVLCSGYDPGRKILSTAGGSEGMRFDLMPLGVASDYLRELLREFPFADDEGRSLSVQIAMMVSRFAATLLPTTAQAPIGIWNANGPSAGKSLLAMVVEIPVKGLASMRAMPEEQSELQKVLDSEVLAGSASIIFDNVKDRIDSAYLEQFATSSVISVRRLGSSAKHEVSKQTMIMITANQAAVSADIARRSLFCDLFQPEADPQKRRIEKEMNATTLERPEVRFQILSALWSLVYHWDKAGRRTGTGRLAGFDEWGRVIGGIVENAGFGSPLRRPVGEHLGDEDGQDMETLVRMMVSGVFRDAIELPCRDGITFDDLIWICRDNGLFAELIRGKTDRETKEFEIWTSSQSKMARLFRRFNGQVFKFDDLGVVKLERVGTNKNNRRWRVS